MPSLNDVRERMEIKGNAIYVTFDYAGDGLSVIDNGTLHGFTIAGSDGVYVNAKAEIVGKDQVKIYNSHVKKPKNVTYAFSNLNQASNLINSSGIPAAPFRTQKVTDTDADGTQEADFSQIKAERAQTFYAKIKENPKQPADKIVLKKVSTDTKPDDSKNTGTTEDTKNPDTTKKPENSGTVEKPGNTPMTENQAESGQIILSANKKTLGVKEKFRLGVRTAGTSGGVKFKTSNKKVAAVSKKGVITAKKKGKAVITAYMPDGVKAVCRITVKKAPTAVKFTAKSKEVKQGKTLQLKVKLSKGSAGSVTYYSNNRKIVKVDKNGKVKALKKGKAVITVKTYNKKTDVCREKQLWMKKENRQCVYSHEIWYF